MNASPRDLLETLIHDVTSKCSSLKSAAAILRQASPKETRELLALMTEESRRLAKDLADFKGES